MDLKVATELKVISFQMKNYKEQGDRLALQITDLERNMSKSRMLFERFADKTKKLSTEKIIIDIILMDLFDKQHSIATSNIIFYNPKIQIERQIFPGTTLYIQGIKLPVKITLNRCILYQKDGVVMQSPLIRVRVA